MDLRLDLGFVYALAELMTEAEVTEKTEVRLKIIALMVRIRKQQTEKNVNYPDKFLKCSNGFV